MTITAGFRVQDGILLCADTMYTGGMKSYQTKIFKTESPGCKVAFALAGIEDYGLMAIQACQRVIMDYAPKQKSINEIQELIRSTLRRLYKEHTEIQPEDEVQLLIGAWTRSDGLRLLSTRKAAVVERPRYKCNGSGSYLAQYLAEAAYQPDMTLRHVILLATQLLAAVKSYDQYCGGQSEMIVLGANGVLSSITHEDIRDSEKHIIGYERYTRKLMFDFGNPQITDEEFRKKVESFVETIMIGRESWAEARRESQAVQMILKELFPEDAGDHQ